MTGAASATVTPALAKLSVRLGLVVKPRADRWHRTPTPLLGGVAIGLPALTAFAVVAPLSQQTIVIVACGLSALLLGLLDDIRHFSPATKLVGQTAVASLVAFGGIRVELVTIAPIAFLLTVFWVVVMMNAVNLMDNMDGLAAGIVAIAGAALAITAVSDARPAALMAAATSGAALGFLVHNFPPAKVFMGDAGSQFLGFALAVAALVHTASGATSVGLAILGPLAVLALPIFDTALVTISRRVAGFPLSRGGMDHASHRLAALGLTDRATVVVLYGIAASLAAVGIVADAASALIVPLFGLAVVALTLFGVFLHEVDAYGWRGPQVRNGGPENRLFRGLWTYGRFGIEIGTDAVLLTMAYYLAYVIRFEGISEAAWSALFIESVPLLLGAQFFALVVLGVYRTLWRYLGISDAALIARALVVGTVPVAIGILVVSPAGYSRSVFALDALLAVALLTGSRAFLLWLRHWFAVRPRSGERRVLIVGANDRGASAARLLASSNGTAYRAVGFLDDDPGKRYRQVGGVPIIGAIADLASVVRSHKVDLVVLASEDVDSETLRTACLDAGVECREFLLPV